MQFLSVCSGIEAASVAWMSLGWNATGFCEKAKFPSALLNAYYPHIHNYGDLTNIEEDSNYESNEFDLLVGGTPCQSFSIAGLRKGLADERGQLLFAYCRILAQKRPRWMVWENVPGVLSSNQGRDFGIFLGALAYLGYGFAYRVLNAQYFGVPQRRRRVFVVGCLGNWRSAAAVLFERASLLRDTKKSRQSAKDVAGTIGACSFTGGAGGRPDGAAVNHFIPTHAVAPTLLSKHCSSHRLDAEAYVTHAVSPALTSRDRKGLSCGRDGLTGAAVISIHDKATRHSGGGTTRKDDGAGNGLGINQSGISYTLTSGDRHAVAFHGAQDPCPSGTTFHPVGRNQGQEVCFTDGLRVRRLTPIECERLQGFPDNYTRISWRGKPVEQCPDGHRYEALGNSMAVPVMHWLGKRIQMVERITTALNEAA
ncbi:DNA (cytosine-5-)-methyltransferase [Halodesulfovibrio aestuarii]|uniref:Cytosine-specific methyltransferase n=1 Tax=Halodesulfovibrio aestuarii TaxID=126333 RepID=A0ABV4JWZ6_9BACT